MMMILLYQCNMANVIGLPSESGWVSTGISTDVVNHRSGDYAPIGDQEDPKLGMFDKPLPCFGWGIGCLLLGFVFPVMWYYATFLYFVKYYQKDPRERTGLEASAVAALICTVAVLIMLAVFVIKALLP
ncbi:hypothetical protein ACFX13_025402 [Malus domestica]